MAIVERLAILIDAQTSGAISDLNRLNAEINRVNTTQHQATGLTGAFDRGLQRLGIESNNTGALLKAGVAAGATAAGYAMLRFGKDAVKSTVDFADSVRTVQQVTGGTAEQASRLNAVLDDYGISGDQASKAFLKLGRGIADGGSSLRDYGVEVARSKDGTVNFNRTLENVAEAYKNTANASDRAKLLNEAFGRSGIDLIPILEQGAKGVKEMYDAVPNGQILTQGDLDAAMQYKLAMDNLNDSVLELKMGIGNALIPAISEVADSMASVIRISTQLSGAFADLKINGQSLTETMRDSGVRGIPVFGAFVQLFRDLKGGASDTQLLTDAQKRVAEATNALSKAAADANTPTAELRDRKKELIQATDEFDRIQRRVNDALDAAKAKTDAATDATRQQIQTAYEAAAAQLGVEGAQLNVERATLRYQQVMADANATDLDRREAYNAAQLAALNYGKQVEDAATKVGDSTEDASRRQVVALRAVADSLAPDNPLRKYLDEYIYRLNVDLPTEKQTILTIDYDKAALAELENYLIGIGLQAPPGRAMGGPVETGKAYIVGERGPEMFVPNTAGRIVPNSAFATQSAEPSVQGGSVATIVVPVSLDGRVVTEVVAANLNRAGGPVISSRAIV